jgi:hypothetical protein
MLIWRSAVKGFVEPGAIGKARCLCGRVTALSAFACRKAR